GAFLVPVEVIGLPVEVIVQLLCFEHLVVLDDDTLIHNNTIVIGEGLETDMIQYDSWGGFSTTARLVDNLFFNESDYAARFNQDGQGRGIFLSNIYSGNFDRIPNDPQAIVGANEMYRNQIQLP
ncbi:MAG: hypothetical protein AAF787_13900, partial [Chloroflexota bacterium]